jgi:hypothetical protein
MVWIQLDITALPPAYANPLVLKLPIFSVCVQIENRGHIKPITRSENYINWKKRILVIRGWWETSIISAGLWNLQPFYTIFSLILFLRPSSPSVCLPVFSESPLASFCGTVAELHIYNYTCLVAPFRISTAHPSTANHGRCSFFISLSYFWYNCKLGSSSRLDVL